MGIRDFLSSRRNPEPAAAVPEFLHIVITRFNMGAFNERWLQYRQELFERLTLPSMDAQTDRNFLWALAIDRDTPPHFRKRLDEIVETRPYIRLVEIELFTDFRRDMIDWCKEEAKSHGVAHYLTTRIDNDDALHRDLLGRIREEARAALAQGSRLPALITPTTGYRWVPATGTGHRAYHLSPSTGTSLLEHEDAFETVYEFGHHRLPDSITKKDGYVKAVDGDTRWWLHATTDASLSVLQNGKHRRDDTIENPLVHDMGEGLLEQFGITDGRRLREIEEPAFVPNHEEIMERGKEIDLEIKRTRTHIRRRRDAGRPDDPDLMAKYAELHERRKENARSLME